VVQEEYLVNIEISETTDESNIQSILCGLYIPV